MQLYMEDGNDKIYIREIESLSNANDVLIFKMNTPLRAEDIEYLENMLSEKTGKKCIVLDYKFDKVLGI